MMITLASVITFTSDGGDACSCPKKEICTGQGCERKQSNAKQSTTYVDLKEEDGAGEYAMSSPKALCMAVTPFLTLTHETALDPTVGVGEGHGGQPASRPRRCTTTISGSTSRIGSTRRSP
jgi:hypothetical protein